MRTCDPARGQQILDTAARLFDKRHYHEVRMEDVAAHAGVAKGTLYRYFQDKEDLYLALLLSSLKRLFEEMKRALEETTVPEEKIRIFIQRSIDFFEKYPYFLDLVQRVESSVDPERLKALEESRAGFFALVTGLIAELNATGKYHAPDSYLAALALTGMNRQVLRFYPKPWPADLAQRLSGMFLRSVARADVSACPGQASVDSPARTRDRKRAR